MVFAVSPYNVSKDYDEDLSLNEYLNLLSNVFLETYRVNKVVETRNKLL